MDDPRQHDEPAAPAQAQAPSALPVPVTLVKGRHRWSFSCDAGSEPSLLRRLNELARCEEVPFDFFDAALVSHQLSRRLKPGLFRIDMDEVDTRPAA
jgi:hypothetical protein